MDNCYLIKDIYKQNDCFLHFARVSQNISMCELIPDDLVENEHCSTCDKHSERDTCQSILAQDLGNPSLCNLIKSDRRSFCKGQVAVKKNNYYICNKIKGLGGKFNCIWSVYVNN